MNLRYLGRADWMNSAREPGDIFDSEGMITETNSAAPPIHATIAPIWRTNRTRNKASAKRLNRARVCASDYYGLSLSTLYLFPYKLSIREGPVHIISCETLVEIEEHLFSCNFIFFQLKHGSQGVCFSPTPPFLKRQWFSFNIDSTAVLPPWPVRELLMPTQPGIPVILVRNIRLRPPRR